MTRIKEQSSGLYFDVFEALCLGKTCLTLGRYQHRGATMSGSRNTGAHSDCCLERAYRGCPDDHDSRYSRNAEIARKKDGFTV